MKPDWTNARSADGPTVVEWVAKRVPIRSDLMKQDAFAAVVSSWNREGRLVDFYTLDQWLTPRGLFLSELPEDCWRWSTPKTRVHEREIAEQIIAEYVAGRGRYELSRAYNLPPRRVRAWTTGVAA